LAVSIRGSNRADLHLNEAKRRADAAIIIQERLWTVPDSWRRLRQLGGGEERFEVALFVGKVCSLKSWVALRYRL
jgi:hypothetical protein